MNKVLDPSTDDTIDAQVRLKSQLPTDGTYSSIETANTSISTEVLEGE